MQKLSFVLINKNGCWSHERTYSKDHIQNSELSNSHYRQALQILDPISVTKPQRNVQSPRPTGQI